MNSPWIYFWYVCEAAACTVNYDAVSEAECRALIHSDRPVEAAPFYYPAACYSPGGAWLPGPLSIVIAGSEQAAPPPSAQEALRQVTVAKPWWKGER